MPFNYPRNIRRKGNSRNGSIDPAKSRAFKRAKEWSNMFIHQKASQLTKEPLNTAYIKWCEVASKGQGLRRTGKA